MKQWKQCHITQFRGYYWFLSNFYPINVDYNGITYPSVEHAYQSQKSIDDKLRLRISRQKEPSMAKYLGRHCERRKDWNNIKEQIMFELLSIKFTKPSLRQKLLETKEAILVEGYTGGDKEWGAVRNHKTGYLEGDNKLGVFLMKLRRQIVENIGDL